MDNMYYPRNPTQASSNGSSNVLTTIIPVLLVVLMFVMLVCCCSRRGWRSMGMTCLRVWYKRCFCRLDCTSKLDLETAIERYSENPPLTRRQIMENICNNSYISKILLHFANELPEFFFSMLPTGSLREEVGKLLPSTAVLATDYDMMLIPDGITVGEKGAQQSTATFTTTENDQIPTGYMWLSLRFLELKHWKSLSLPRHVEDKVGHYLSITKIHDLLKTTFRSIIFTEIDVTADKATAEMNGPALTIKVERKVKSFDSCTSLCCPCCTGNEKELILFYCDFTVGLHHPQWPRKAANWFSPSRRQHWPTMDVVKVIRDRGCHVVPKPSIKGILLKYNTAQPTLTTYDQAPHLEWRYSFSQPEIELANCIPEVAKKAFMALKAVKKAHLDSKIESVKNLKSYTLKTILLRAVEQRPSDDWLRIGPGDIFLELLENLRQALTTGSCIHYWIDGMNLLEEFTQPRLSALARMVEKIQKEPHKYVADNWLEVTRCLRFYCFYCGGKKQYIPVHTAGPILSDPCCLIPCSYKDVANRTCCPCPYDDINFEVY